MNFANVSSFLHFSAPWMSLTNVNLKKAKSLELADIPITFLEAADYKSINELSTSVAFCDTTPMNNSKPTAPVYVNKQPEDVRWLSMNED